MYVQTAVTLFNKRLGADRREAYLPTCILGASYAEAKKANRSPNGVCSENLAYRLRIPVDAKTQNSRTYVNEKAFKTFTTDEAARHWTLQKGDVLLTAETALEGPLDERRIKELAAELRVDVITVTEYADNTARGTDAVKHWRIGGG